MNKRKAKKKYKQIYEEALKRNTIFIDLDNRWLRDNTSTVRLKSDGRVVECGILFHHFEYKPFAVGETPEVSLTGDLKWFNEVSQPRKAREKG